MNNAEIIQKIKSGDKSALEYVYVKYRIDFISWIMSAYKISNNDARELYQQTIVIFYENIMEGRLNNMTGNIKTYLFAIGKNKFFELTRQWSKTTTEHSFNVEEEREPASNEETERKEYLINLSENALMQLGSPCKELLELYYYHKKSMSEIAETLGYKNEDTAKNQKYKCLNRLREIFHEKLKRENKVLYE